MAAKKRPRTAAQKAATRRMIAANRARRSGGAKRPARSAAPAAPKRRRRSAYKQTSPGIVTHKSGRRYRRPTRTQASAAGRTLRYARKRNPIGLGGFIGNTLVPSAVGAGGALLLDVAMGLVPLPAALKTGSMSPVARVAGAVGLGWLASKVVGKRTADQLASGAITVTLYQLARGFIARTLPGKVPGLSDWSEMGEYVGEYVGDYSGAAQIGEYVGASDPELGYINSGVMVGDGEMEGFETGVYR